MTGKPAREFNVIIECDADGYYVGSVSELPGCHMQAKSIDILLERLKEAVALYLQVPSDEVGLHMIDGDYLRGLSSTLEEWNSEADEEAYRALQM